MGKLCPRGKAAAKRKFKVYPSAYANMYASAVCSGKVTPGGKKKKKAGGGPMTSNGVSQARKAISSQRRVMLGKGGDPKKIVSAACGALEEGRRKKTKLYTG